MLCPMNMVGGAFNQFPYFLLLLLSASVVSRCAFLLCQSRSILASHRGMPAIVPYDARCSFARPVLRGSLTRLGNLGGDLARADSPASMS